MKNLKIATFFIALAICLGFTLNCSAAPLVNSNNNIDYLYGSSDLSRAYFGLHIKGLNRNVEIGRIKYQYKGDKTSLYAGYYFMRWWSVYVTASDSTVEIFNYSKDSATELGIGMYFDILDHDIKDSDLIEDKIRINAGIEYSIIDDISIHNESHAKVEEFSASATLSLVNDLDRNILFTPNSIALFVGPVYSYLDSTTLTTKDTMGYTFGGELYYSEKVYFTIGIYDIGEAELMGGVHLRL